MESSGNNSTSPKGHKHNTRLKANGFRICYKEDSDLSDNNSNEDEDDNFGELDIYKYNQMLGHLFPSKYMNNKINRIEQQKKNDKK